MEKYTDVHEEVGQRFKKNEDLYKSISDQELDKYTGIVLQAWFSLLFLEVSYKMELT